MNFLEQEIIRFDIEKKLNNLLYFPNVSPLSLEWGMNYITFAPSKRIRPLLLLEANSIFSEPDPDAFILAASVELIHTYSLVHDDLPCMDNDELRRGLKTLHVLKDEAYALLVGDALLTRGLCFLANYHKHDKFTQIMQLFLDKTGYSGMIYGQLLDLDAENKKLSLKDIQKINRFKTSALFELCMMIGAINGSADLENIKKLEQFGHIIGEMFQLQDDILDIIGDEEILGKKIGSDAKKKKSSIPLIIGLEQSKQLLLEYKAGAISYIEQFPSNRDFFYQLLDFFIKRTQ